MAYPVAVSFLVALLLFGGCQGCLGTPTPAPLSALSEPSGEKMAYCLGRDRQGNLLSEPDVYKTAVSKTGSVFVIGLFLPQGSPEGRFPIEIECQSPAGQKSSFRIYDPGSGYILKFDEDLELKWKTTFRTVPKAGEEYFQPGIIARDISIDDNENLFVVGNIGPTKGFPLSYIDGCSSGFETTPLSEREPPPPPRCEFSEKLKSRGGNGIFFAKYEPAGQEYKLAWLRANSIPQLTPTAIATRSDADGATTVMAGAICEMENVSGDPPWNGDWPCRSSGPFRDPLEYRDSGFLFFRFIDKKGSSPDPFGQRMLIKSGLSTVGFGNNNDNIIDSILILPDQIRTETSENGCVKSAGQFIWSGLAKSIQLCDLTRGDPNNTGKGAEGVPYAMKYEFDPSAKPSVCPAEFYEGEKYKVYNENGDLKEEVPTATNFNNDWPRTTKLARGSSRFYMSSFSPKGGYLYTLNLEGLRKAIAFNSIPTQSVRVGSPSSAIVDVLNSAPEQVLVAGSVPINSLFDGYLMQFSPIPKDGRLPVSSALVPCGKCAECLRSVTTEAKWFGCPNQDYVISVAIDPNAKRMIAVGYEKNAWPCLPGSTASDMGAPGRYIWIRSLPMPSEGNPLIVNPAG